MCAVKKKLCDEYSDITISSRLDFKKIINKDLLRYRRLARRNSEVGVTKCGECLCFDRV